MSAWAHATPHRFPLGASRLWDAHPYTDASVASCDYGVTVTLTPVEGSRRSACNCLMCSVFSGAGGRTRTDDLLITNQLLYQLSYAGKA